MGLLTASQDSDLLDASSWSKSPTPVLQSANGVYGPGHNSFTVSADGAYDILVYHGRDYEEISGDLLDDPNRHTRVQQLRWNADGTPNFGEPVANGPTTIGDRSSQTQTIEGKMNETSASRFKRIVPFALIGLAGCNMRLAKFTQIEPGPLA